MEKIFYERAINFLRKMDLIWQILHGMDLEKLQEKLILARTIEEKKAVLFKIPKIKSLYARLAFSFLPSELELIALELCAIGQSEKVFRVSDLELLVPTERFYQELGGVLGYQVEVLKRIKKTECTFRDWQIRKPEFIDVSLESTVVLDGIYHSLKHLDQLAEVYPLGGAADRLHLLDQKTNQELPAAKLQFGGRSLLETMVRDLEAREWLCFQIFKKKVTTPIAIMTSMEKENHQHVVNICEEKKWFGRPKESFCFFIQPSVPTVDEEGNWHVLEDGRPLLKPGGHGVLWKLAKDQNVFSWLCQLGCKKGIVRQINNPIAGIDYGLLAFSGIGMIRDFSFGFVSCQRLVKAAEGMIVLLENSEGETVLTNIEYCDFEKYGIVDEPIEVGNPFSKYSSNTNILFVDLKAIEKAVEAKPYPGLLMNLKSLSQKKGVKMGRLESTMQNIADVFLEKRKNPEKTFVTFNHRSKTISVAKKAFLDGNALETPEQCFYELLSENQNLLGLCQFEVPSRISLEQYLKEGPNCLFLYNPALGPVYSLISQKIRGGKMFPKSEFILEIAEADISNLQISGSLQIMAESAIGKNCQFELAPRIHLKNVEIKNRGVNWEQSSPFWKMDSIRHESVLIELKGWSEFEAIDVCFEGAYHFIVEEGQKMKISQNGKNLKIEIEPIDSSPFWKYSWENGIKIQR